MTETLRSTSRGQASRGRRPSMSALVLITGIGPLATDTYNPALPALQAELGTTAAVAQLTLTTFIIGSGLGQLVLGPVSDARGRRGLLVASSVAFGLSSLLCALTPGATLLVAARLVQGLAAGAGAAIGRAVVGDAAGGGARAAQAYGTLASITFLAPVAAPVVGGGILAVGSWRTVFACLVVLGMVMLAATLAGVPETLPPGQRHDPHLRSTLRGMGSLLRERAFAGEVGLLALATFGFFTYIGGSAFVLETVYGISETRYAVIFATNAAAMALMGTTFRLTVARFGARRLRDCGIGLSAAGAAGLLAAALAGGGRPPLAVTWVLLALLTAGMGLTFPSVTALAQAAGDHARGTASALQGGCSSLVGAAVSPLTGLIGYDSVLPMAALIAGGFAAAVALRLLVVRGPRPGAVAA